MKLFGPIFRFELVRIARRQRLTLSRCAFALALFALAATVYSVAYKELEGQFTLREVARVTEGLFYALIGILFAVAMMFTPQWTGDAITGEKERRTLPFLLLTDLTSREIILGKLASRLTQLGLFMLAGLPVLVGLQFFGGIEPLFVLLGAAALGATMWSVGSLSMLWSVYARTPRAATQRTGQVVALYIVGMMISGQLLATFPTVGHWPPGSRFDLLDAHDWLNIANPLAAVNSIVTSAGGTFSDTLWSVFRGYFFSHLALGLVFTTWAIRRLRPVAAAAPHDGPPPELIGVAPRKRPPIKNRPVYWKMLWCDARPTKTRLGRTIANFVYVLSFAPVLAMLAFAFHLGGQRAVSQTINFYTRMVVTIVLSGMLLFVAGLAGGCIGRERNKQTLDDLLLTDLTTDEILKQKWLASVWSVRWMMLWVLLHWALAIAVGALHPLAVPVVALLWIVDVVYAASMGMYFAARTWTTQKAHFWTTMIGLLLTIAPLSAGMIVMWVTQGRPIWPVALFVISPPAALGVSAFSPDDFLDMQHGQPSTLKPMIWGAALCLLIHAILAGWFWSRAKHWFPRMIGRK